MEQYRFPAIVRMTFVLLFTILLFYAIIIAEDILAPVCLAILFSSLLHPFVEFMEKHKFPRILANLIAILVLLAILTTAVFLIFKQLEALVADFPTLKQKALANIDQLELFIESSFGIESHKTHLWLKKNVSALFDTGSNFMKETFSATTSTIFKLGILPVFVFYMLLYRDRFNSFILSVVPKRRKQTTIEILKRISNVTQHYMTGVFVVVLILSFINSLGLFLIGLKYAMIFGIISAFFNFIPYFGTWIGGAIPIIFALLTGDSPQLALGVIIFFIIVQFTENNILTPNITGSYVNLNPFITILSIIVGGMVWGIIGMFVVVPLMASLKIVFDYTESLQPYSMLIGIPESKGRKKGLDRIKQFLINRRKSRS
ncbi:MAG: AI-2E family transporter [Bacteroidales bacterium]|nr:AI-2E family transporter [Bacteroidales bacterium]